MADTINMVIKRDGVVLMEHELSRFSINDGNLSLGLKSAQAFDIPMIFQGVYDVDVIIPEQIISKSCIYLSYNYMVFSNTITEEDGSKRTYLECSDNGLLFKVIG